MIILSIRRMMVAVAVAGALASCSNELDVMAPYKDIPVVYCVLNPGDSVHYLRLEKSFLGAGNALVMAREADSVYYPGAEISLQRWVDGSIADSATMELTPFPVRDSGIFVNDPNYLYTYRGQVMENSEYRVNIRVPSTGAHITGSTHTIGLFKVIRPESFKRTLPFSSYDNYQTVEWLTAPYTRIYQLTVRFHYLEVTGTDTAFLSADWNIGQYITQFSAGGEKMTADFLQRNFYKWVGNKIRRSGKDAQLLANKRAIDFIFTVGGDELYTYLQIYQEDSGILKEKPVFTNIINGIGIFSSRYRQSVDGKALSDHSIDSLAYGIYTRDLGFADSQNDYYYTGY